MIVQPPLGTSGPHSGAEGQPSKPDFESLLVQVAAGGREIVLNRPELGLDREIEIEGGERLVLDFDPDTADVRFVDLGGDGRLDMALVFDIGTAAESQIVLLDLVSYAQGRNQPVFEIKGKDIDSEVLVGMAQALTGDLLDLPIGAELQTAGGEGATIEGVGPSGSGTLGDLLPNDLKRGGSHEYNDDFGSQLASADPFDISPAQDVPAISSPERQAESVTRRTVVQEADQPEPTAPTARPLVVAADRLRIDEDSSANLSVTATTNRGSLTEVKIDGSVALIAAGWTITATDGGAGGSFDPSTGLYTTANGIKDVVLTITLAPPGDSDLDVETTIGQELTITATARIAGDDSNSLAVAANVDVDALADSWQGAPEGDDGDASHLSVSIEDISDSDDGNKTFQTGETGTITFTATFDDFQDGSETHLVELHAPEGFAFGGPVDELAAGVEIDPATSPTLLVLNVDSTDGIEHFTATFEIVDVDAADGTSNFIAIASAEETNTPPPDEERALSDNLIVVEDSLDVEVFNSMVEFDGITEAADSNEIAGTMTLGDLTDDDTISRHLLDAGTASFAADTSTQADTGEYSTSSALIQSVVKVEIAPSDDMIAVTLGNLA